AGLLARAFAPAVGAARRRRACGRRRASISRPGRTRRRARPVARDEAGRMRRGERVAGPSVRARSRGDRIVEAVLSAVLPVYNGGAEIVGNVDVIRRALATGLPNEDVEVIVVSDGSIDETASELAKARGDVGFRL